jgi:hypothetical protein
LGLGVGEMAWEIKIIEMVNNKDNNVDGAILWFVMDDKSYLGFLIYRIVL